MTLLSYVVLYRLFRYIADRVFGKDADAGYKRVATAFATLLLSPRFRYNNDEGQDAIEGRWFLIRSYHKLFSFPKKKKDQEEIPEMEEVSPQENSDSVPLSEN